MHRRLLDHLSAAVVAVGGIALIVLVATTGWQVFGRYVLNDTPTWAERLSLLLILFVSLPIAAVGLREDFHLGISFVSEMLPAKAQRLLRMFNALVLGAFGALMAYYSYGLTALTWNRSIPLLGVPQGVQYIPLVITGVLIVVFMLERFFRLLRNPVFAPWSDDLVNAVADPAADMPDPRKD